MTKCFFTRKPLKAVKSVKDVALTDYKSTIAFLADLAVTFLKKVRSSSVILIHSCSEQMFIFWCCAGYYVTSKDAGVYKNWLMPLRPLSQPAVLFR